MIPTSDHNEALTGDTLYSAFLNYEWREIVLPYIIRGMDEIAATIEDETERQTFEVRFGAMIDDFYNEDIVDGTPVASVVWFPSPSIPAKWLKCAGQTIYESDYPALYAALPDFQFVEVGTGFDIIILPDLSDRFLYGANNDTEIADTGGATTHTLTIAEMPAHVHDVSKANVTGTAIQRAMTGNNTQVGLQQTSSVGGDGAHNNMPPFFRGYWIIKALP